jgi:hypothetical protein
MTLYRIYNGTALVQFPPEGGINAMAYCHGDGTTDDTAHILSAIAAADGAPVYFYDGTYLLSSTLTVPDGTTLVGESLAGTHLKGAVVYGSNSSFSDLRIGDVGKTGVVNGPGASNTTFTRCQFRGGGGAVGRSPMYFGGGKNSCDHLTFTDCNVERNLGDHEVAPGESNWNNVNWTERVDSLDGAHMEYITFTRCHFGVSNGREDIPRNIGCPRMNVELYQFPGEGGSVRTGWHNVTFQDCVFEAGDCSTLDAPSDIYNNDHTDAYLTLDGCTFYGGGVTGDYWQGGVTLEGINHATIHDNDFYPARQYTLSMATQGPPSHGVSITDNRFHLDDYTHGGIDAHNTEPQIWLEGNDGIFTGNVVHNSTGGYWILWLGWYYDDQQADGWTITGNHFHELRTSSQRMAWVEDATDCTITGNTFQTEASSFPSGTPVTYAGTNTGTTVVDGTNNTLVHG